MKTALYSSVSFLFQLCLIFDSVHGQTDKCNHCAEILKTTIYNDFEHIQKTSFESATETMFKRTFEEWDAMNTSTAQSQNVGASYGLFSASYSGYSNKIEAKNKYVTDQKNYQNSASTKSSTLDDLVKKEASVDQITAWKNCIQTCNPGKITSEVFGSDHDFVLKFTYCPQSGGDPDEIQVLSITPSSSNTIKVTGGDTKVGTKIKQWGSGVLQIKRTDYSLGNIIINIKPLGAFTLALPGGNDDPYSSSFYSTSVPNSLPVGTVITSLLPFENFSKLVGQDPTSIDNLTLQWVPSDGRSVNGSRYARILDNVNKKASVPDLRGVFLRGLNKMSDLEPNAVPEQQKDPQTERPVGSFEGDQIISHSHPVRQKPHSHDIQRGILADGEGHYGFGGKVSGGSDAHDFNRQTVSATTIDITIDPFGGQETRPKNVCVYYYIKIN